MFDMTVSHRHIWAGWIKLAVMCGVTTCGGSFPAHLASAAPQSPAAKFGKKAAPDYGIDQVRQINTLIRQGWQEYKLKPSRPANEGQWCRRVYLDVLGRIPTVDELFEYLGDKSPRAKAKLVHKLLHEEPQVEQYAANWTTLWTNILIGRSGGNGNNSLASREGMQKYLRESFLENKRYDKLVDELVSATGSSTPGSAKFNGAVNFLVDKLADNGAQATAQTSRIFLGLQVQCTQCHNHPFNEWKQRKYWEMNSFFRQTRALRRFVPGSDELRQTLLANQDFAGESGDPQEADVFYELRNGLMKVAYPTFVDGTAISKSGYLDQNNRREQLALLIVQSQAMQQAIANRMWQHFLGYGFTKPIDDMGTHNRPSHPRLLDYLGTEFRKSSFNMKELIRWIVLSQPYSLSSRMNKDNAQDDPLLGEKPRFSHFYLRQMRAEELYESLLVATQAHKTRVSYEEQQKAKAAWLDQFTIAFGTDEGDETTTFNGTIPQALMMFNGGLIKQATSGQPGSFMYKVAQSDRKPRDKIRYLYQAALSRTPTKRETGFANHLLAAHRGNVTEALEDIWWALLNRNEFIFNH